MFVQWLLKWELRFVHSCCWMQHIVSKLGTLINLLISWSVGWLFSRSTTWAHLPSLLPWPVWPLKTHLQFVSTHVRVLKYCQKCAKASMEAMIIGLTFPFHQEHHGDFNPVWLPNITSFSHPFPLPGLWDPSWDPYILWDPSCAVPLWRCLSIFTSKDLNAGVLNFILLQIQHLHTVRKLRTPTDTVETCCFFMLDSKVEFAVPRLCGCSSIQRRLANE